MNYKLILLEQREEVDFLFKEKIIAREKLKEFQPLISSRLIKVVSGIRRCGKSVLIHHALRESKIPYAYVNFDDERLLGIKASDLNDIFETLMQIYPGVTTYYFDEIQNVLGWELFVNRLKRQGLHIYVTGSNAKLLSKELATHLTGRHLELELMPFSFREFLAYHDISPQTSLTSSKIAQVKKYFEKYFENGGFPEVVAGEQPGIYLRTLFDNIMMRDIVARYHLRYPNELKELGRYILGHPGMRFTYNSLNKTFKVKSVHTLQKYIAYLKETYLVYELLQFDFKKKERLKKPRKLYPCDIGIHRALGMESYQGEGRRLELMILSCLVNSAQSVYYGEVSSSEIDFITEKNGKVTSLIQSCYSIKDIETMQREIKALEKGAEHFHCTNLLVISWDEESRIAISKNLTIHVVPIWKWLLNI